MRPASAALRVARTRTSLLLTALILVLPGCGASVDKAGGRRSPKPRVLTLASGAGNVSTLQVFADEVARISHGRMQIRFRSDWRRGEVAFESDLIRDVQRGAADIGWTGTRAWDAVGVSSFDALHMPLLVDSLALEAKVLDSPLPAAMLSGLAPLGLVGLGVLPGPLRKPLAVDRPLLAPSDYRGRHIAINDSRLARETLKALTAIAVPIPSAGRIVGLDGIEQQVESVYRNHYDQQARYLTGNVDLWPRPVVLFMTRRRFRMLSSADREVLAAAARAAVSPMLALQRKFDAQAVAGLCHRGLVVADASTADLAALRQSVAGVYAAADVTTRARVHSIEAIKAALAAPPDAVRACPRSPGEVVALIPDGAYTVTITRQDALRAGLPRSDDLAQIPRQQFRLVLHSGAFTLYELHSRPPTVGFAGTLSLYRDRIVATGDNGDALHARWSMSPRGLRFTDVTVPGAGRVNDYSVVWGSHLWVKAG
jgi:TRAP-type C4-dicarboxylate transport system substrate-binding protein